MQRMRCFNPVLGVVKQEICGTKNCMNNEDICISYMNKDLVSNL